MFTFGATILLNTALRLIFNSLTPNIEYSLAQQVWVIFLQLTDPGNMSQDKHSFTNVKTAAVVAGLTGVVIFSALIAFLTTALDQAIAHLKRGHSHVLKEGQTLVLGWSPRVI